MMSRIKLFVFFVVVIIVKRLYNNLNGKLVWLEGKILLWIIVGTCRIMEHTLRFHYVLLNDVADIFVLPARKKKYILASVKVERRGTYVVSILQDRKLYSQGRGVTF